MLSKALLRIYPGELKFLIRSTSEQHCSFLVYKIVYIIQEIITSRNSVFFTIVHLVVGWFVLSITQKTLNIYTYNFGRWAKKEGIQFWCWHKNGQIQGLFFITFFHTAKKKVVFDIFTDENKSYGIFGGLWQSSAKVQCQLQTPASISLLHFHYAHYHSISRLHMTSKQCCRSWNI